MSGKIYTILPAIPQDMLATAGLFVATIGLCTVLVLTVAFPNSRREG